MDRLVVMTLHRRVRAVHRLPRELRHPALFLPAEITGPKSLQAARRILQRTSAVRDGVAVAQRSIPRDADTEPLSVTTYRSSKHSDLGPALLWFHPGGLVLGSVEESHALCSRLADELDVLVVSVDYRLAPEHPFPAAHDDGLRALQWLRDTADELGVDPARIAIGGQSAGGGLAASLAQSAHDEGFDACFQLLLYPMLDDRTVLRRTVPDSFHLVWGPASNKFGWTSYLGHTPTEDDPRPYIAAARRTDLRGLPPTWIGVGTVDLFHDECLEYAARLRAAGVECTLKVVPSMFHGADVICARAPSMITFRDDAIRTFAATLNSLRSEDLPASPRDRDKNERHQP